MKIYVAITLSIFSITTALAQTEAILTTPYLLKFKDGEAQLPSGSKLKVASVTSKEVFIHIAGGIYSIPINSTNLSTNTSNQNTSETDTIQPVKNGYEEKLTKLADQFKINKKPEYESDDYSEYSLCKLLGQFMDTESKTSGLYFSLGNATNFAHGLLGENLPTQELFTHGILKFQILQRVWNHMNGEDIGIKCTGKFDIDILDIPFLFYSRKKSKEWQIISKNNNLEAEIEKEIGTSPSGLIKTTFITGYGLNIIVNGFRVYDYEERITGVNLVDYIDEQLPRSIIESRNRYTEKLSAEKEAQAKARKKDQDEINTSKLFK